MESRFRDKISKILARHKLNVVLGNRDGSVNSFIFLLAHENREEAKENWDAIRVDPEFSRDREIGASRKDAGKSRGDIHVSERLFAVEIG
jgi:hypothetical protein